MNTVALVGTRAALAVALGVDRSTLWRRLARCPAAVEHDGQLLFNTIVLEELAGYRDEYLEPPALDEDPGTDPPEALYHQEPPLRTPAGHRQEPNEGLAAVWSAAAELLAVAAADEARGDHIASHRRAAIARDLLDTSISSQNPSDVAKRDMENPSDVAFRDANVAKRDADRTPEASDVAIRDADVANSGSDVAERVAFRDADPPHEMRDIYILNSTHYSPEIANNETAEPDEPEAVPAADRDFPPGTEAGKQFARKAVTAVADAAQAQTGRAANIGPQAVNALARWPESWVSFACEAIAGDIADGSPVRNPGAMLCVAARRGWLRYFPLEDPSAAKASDIAARAASFTSWLQAVGVDNPADAAGYAAERSRGDPDLLDALVDACATAGLDPGDVRAALPRPTTTTTEEDTDA